MWDKGIPFDFTMSMAEIAALSEEIGTISKIYKLRVAGAEDRIHPTQKPVKLYEKLLDTYAKADWKILDTHLGSGSIALAVDKANRLDKMNLHLTACEIDLDYVNASIKRISNYLQQTTINF